MATISLYLRRAWSWVKSGEVIASILDLSGLGKALVGAIGSMSLGAWALIDQLPGSIVALMILAGFTGAIWAVNGIQWWRQPLHQI